MIRPALILILGCVTFWGILAYPAFRLWAFRGLVESSVAAILCLVPSAIILVWSSLARRRPQDHLRLVLGGTGIRMGMVLGLGLLLGLIDAAFREPSFWAWVLVFYLFTLALDIVVLLKARLRPLVR